MRASENPSSSRDPLGACASRMLGRAMPPASSPDACVAAEGVALVEHQLPADHLPPPLDPCPPSPPQNTDAATAADDNSTSKEYVHIRIQQRNGKKNLTTVQGLAEGVDYKRVLKAFKKEFCCNGNVVEDPELGQVGAGGGRGEGGGGSYVPSPSPYTPQTLLPPCIPSNTC